MPFAVADAAPLLLLPPILLLIIGIHVLARGGLGETRLRLALALRVLIASALVFALAGASVTLPTDRLATIFVVDLSESVGNAGRQQALTFVRQALAERREGDLAGVVAFGRDALVERLPDELADVDRLASTPVRSATDIGAALRLAAALFPDDAQKRIVLLSDGNDTTGSGQVEASRARVRGVSVDTVVTGLGAADEVTVERLGVPSAARLGETLPVVADISSTVAQPAAVRLFVDGALAETRRVDLRAGVTTVAFETKPRDAGFHRLRVVVEAGRDTFVQNNRADANTLVSGPPRVLVVATDPADAADLVTALRAREGSVVQAVPEQVPDDVASLIGYDSIVLVNVARPRFTAKQLEALRTSVRDYGRGLVMIGGEESFGAGGYRDTPLEAALPVEMRVRSKEKQPDVALVVVMDQSGSMAACHCNSFDRGMAGNRQLAGVQKVDIGKEAILRAAAALTSRDEFGVVTFNEQAHWVVRTSPLGSVGDLQDTISGVRADGQTNVIAGLDEAVKSLEQTKATRRHLILLTDGWSSSGDYNAILARIKAAGITLSTVGAGGGSNPFLQDLATQGGGRFYPANDPSTIPDIFLKETQQVAGQQIIEETFFPTVTGSSPITRGIDGLPSLLGYNGTTIKAAAAQVLASGRSDPVLAQWQYGLGRAVAWTSDASSRWARNWVGWSGFTRFFGQLVSWTFPGEDAGGIEARFVTTSAGTTLRVESVGPDGSPRDFFTTDATVVDPALESRLLGLSQVAPGVYEVPVGELTPGAYAIRVTQTKAGSAAVGRTLGLVAPTPAEYRLLGTNAPLLAAIRSATGGAAVTAPAEVWRHDLGSTTRDTPLWPWLLLVALLLWPLDVFLRRVALGRRDLRSGARWVREIPARRGRVAVRTAPAEAMLATRGRATSAGARAALTQARTDDGAAGATAGDAAAPATTRAGVAAAAPMAEGVAAATRAAPTAPAAAPGAATTAPPAKAPPPPGVPASPPAGDDADTLSRLREARRRARR